MLCSVFCCFQVWGLSVLKQLSYIASISLGLLREKVNIFTKWTKLRPHLHANQSIQRTLALVPGGRVCPDLELKRVVNQQEPRAVKGPT